MRLVALLLVVIVRDVAAADIVSAAPDAVEVTIYRASPGLTSDIADTDEEASGIAMISETRTIALPAGVSTVKFRGVAETIVPQSAKLESLPGGIIETNFDYQLLGSGELIANSIGKSVQVVRTDKHTGIATAERAVLLSGPEGVVLNVNGKIEALNCSGAIEKLVFDEVPASLTDKPTLSATLRTTQAGRYKIRLSYLATGLDWSADYVARINPDGRTLNLSAWITLANKQSTSFVNAPVQVIAGNIARDADTKPVQIAIREHQAQCWPIGKFFSLYDALKAADRLRTFDKMQVMPMAAQANELEAVIVTGSYIAQQRDLGDYKLYALPVPTTVAANQIKQVQMLDQRNVKFERIYVYTLDLERIHSDNGPVVHSPLATLRLQNKKANGLGKPLPAGAVSVMETDHNQRMILAGQKTLHDLPVGLPIDIELGEAMDIAIEPRVLREYTSTGRLQKERADMEVTLTNNKPSPVVLELLQRKDEEADFRIVSETKHHAFKYGMPMWTIAMQSGERVTLRYTIEHAD